MLKAHITPYAKMALLLLGLSSLVGCAQVLAQRIHQSKSYAAPAIKPEVMQRLNPKLQQICVGSELCMRYWQIQPAAEPAERLKFSMNAEVNAAKSVLALEINRADLIPRQGTVLLLHGYRGSKEWLALSALYFQYLGFEVLVPDLLGHGESDGDVAFGVADAKFLQQLTAKRRSDGPLLIVANSMGALSAAHLLASKQEVAGVMLQAPMQSFDMALQGYVAMSERWYRKAFSEQQLVEAAELALAKAGVSVAQTDLQHYKAHFTMPTLILTADNDLIAPYQFYAGWQGPQFYVKQVADRHHALMSVISQQEHEWVQQWLALIPATQLR
ncbi:alpha/beta hydrolase [Alishewanella sp. HL-SH06]|uniref:alpha/beta hydrolase n=1 Tax=Alishewanella sp. HL-SH06 TaxID=3461144 RepID=UPI00404322D6